METAGGTRMEQHPDIVAMRARHEQAAAKPVVQMADGLLMVAGLFLAISPWVVGFANLTPLTVNNLITGIAVTVLALGFSSVFGRMYGIAWVAPLIGIWTIIAPWVISGDMSNARTIWTNVIVGAVILLLGLTAQGLGMARGRR
ncbi:MAG TPA: SPW repeat protein [Thermopolyspora sp.]|jgi:SPW repeat.